MLEIDGTEYRIEDLRALAKTLREDELTPTTVVGLSGLTYRHMCDPRVSVLLQSRARYGFASWAAMTEALDEHWRFGTGHGQSEAIPARVSDRHLVLPRLDGFGVPTVERLEDLLAAVRDDSGEEVEPVEVPKLDPSWANTASSAAPIVRENALTKLWGACGPSSESLIERLFIARGRVVSIYRRVFDGIHDASLLEAVLRMPVRATTLIQVREESVHEFTIEKRSDGSAYLHQGYLSGYSAIWWAGVPAAERQPFLSLTGEPAAALRRARDVYGRGRPIPLAEFAGLVKRYLQCDEHGTGSALVWAKLPFNPGVPDDAARWGKEIREDKAIEARPALPITLSVQVFQLRDEPAVHRAFGDGTGTLPLTTMVMAEAGGLIP